MHEGFWAVLIRNSDAHLSHLALDLNQPRMQIRQALRHAVPGHLHPRRQDHTIVRRRLIIIERSYQRIEEHCSRNTLQRIEAENRAARIRAMQTGRR